MGPKKQTYTGIDSHIPAKTTKRAEATLQFAREQQLSVFNSIDEIIYVADPHTHEILYVNKAAQRLFQKNTVGGLCYKEFQGFDHPCEFCNNEIILKMKGKPYNWEYHNPILNRDFAIVDRIIRWPDGRDVRFEIATDITERKRVEKELRENGKKYRSLYQEFEGLLNGIPDSIALVSPDLKFIWANKNTTVVFNKALPDIIGQYCYQVRHNRTEPCEICPVRRSYESKQPETEETTTPEGISVNIRAVPIMDEQGAVKGVIEIGREIT
jgi:PAS domain-containing protein